MQDRLSELTKQYRVHFGDDLKVKKEEKEKVKIQQKKQKDDIEEEDEFAQFQEEGGDQSLPQHHKAKK